MGRVAVSPCLGDGLVVRRVVMRARDVVFFKGIMEASEGLAAVFAFGAVLGVNVYGLSQGDVLIFGVAVSVMAESLTPTPALAARFSMAPPLSVMGTVNAPEFILYWPRMPVALTVMVPEPPLKTGATSKDKMPWLMMMLPRVLMVGETRLVSPGPVLVSVKPF